MLCWECSHRLLSCASFIGLAKRSDSLLNDLLLVEPYLTPENIKSLDIDKFYTTKLKSKLFPTNHSDLNIEESESEATSDQKHIDPIHDSNDENSQSDVEIKLEIYEDDERESNCDPDVENYDQNEIFTNCLNVKESKSVGRMKNKKNCKTPEELDPNTFVTTTLSMEEQVKEVIQRKETENYKNSPFKCDQCYKGFLDEGIYRSHMTRHSDLCGIYVCEVCKLHFFNVRALRHHLTSHTHRFSCKRCPFVTPRRYAAKLHNKYHNGTRYNCSQCNEDFGKFSTYMSHLRIKHPSDFVCELCGHSFVSTKGLALHRSLKHRFDQRVVTGNSVKCEECNINFVCEEALQQHRKVSAKHKDGQLIRTNKETKGFNCESNERTAKKKVVKTLKRLSRHKSKGPIICEQCDKQLPNALAYHWHFRNAHPDKNRTRYPAKPHRCMCEVCGKMFQSLALLHDHSWSHTGVKQFQCSQCHKTFARRYRLIAHRRLHAADRRRHPCSVCGKLFSTLSNLQRHKATHSGLRPFKCEMCGKCFKHASLLKDHVKYVHMKAPWPKRTRGKHSEVRTTLSQTTTATGASETNAGLIWDG
ncbi:oocyte zinc finger protein XlCOF6-like isoform X2 [Battus philenor]